ncbi:secreted RxLR effector peptide protein, putative [Phytophthora infestans T30-4]|uniref:Secreted RxLR effector peptide protein, putative n=1 Tax=Phytophthora infestans (strain T30-4) TaxID=403677 RepID=D0N904_PHYIT|nr:secreted RxLR effector peptide protein, putative [Phytophthora infestans T30-4]EEY54039.1 secreted RxLR effector peptide protein, putative [Phytophthora infestans T30-4]|eukprot:XP_002904670.1 secreted RxLR effector peptide protein, putative [Phytophthora infestans T30-4]
MRIILYVVLLLAAHGTIATADNPVEIQDLEVSTHRKHESQDYRYLRGNNEATKTDGVEEERTISTPQFDKLSALLSPPKFSNLPLIKQVNKVRISLAKKLGSLYLKKVRKAYERNPNNFV